MLNISNLPNSMQNVVSNLLVAFNELQSPDGPIIPRPGPIFPIDEADIEIDDIISNPLMEINNAQTANIKI